MPGVCVDAGLLVFDCQKSELLLTKTSNYPPVDFGFRAGLHCIALHSSILVSCVEEPSKVAGARNVPSTFPTTCAKAEEPITLS